MIRRLVFDIAWRSRQMYVVTLPGVVVIWALVAAMDPQVDHSLVTLGLAMSMTFAYLFGPLVSVSMVGLREIRILPVTNRDLWVTTWIVSAILIPLVITVVQCLPVIAVATYTGSSAVSAETLLLSSLYCFAYAGALVPITPALGYSLNHMTTRRPRWLWISIAVVCILVFIGGLGLPYLLSDYLPLTFDQFSWGTMIALVMCFVISAASLAWTPQRGGIVTPVQPARKAQSARSKERQRITDRFTGIPRVAGPLVAAVIIMSAATLAGFVAYWAAFDYGTPLRSFLRDNAVLLFDTGFLPNPGMGDMWVPMALAFMATSSPWAPFSRLLKVLPLTTSQINALFLGTPFALWAMVWLALIATHVAVIGSFPVSVRPDVFVFVGGVSALAHVLAMRYGHRSSLGIIFLMAALMSVAKRLPSTMPVEATLLVVGLAALVVAAVVNHRTLTRSTSSSKAYRGRSLPFGISAPGARP